jgi:hypothetical protein
MRVYVYTVSRIILNVSGRNSFVAVLHLLGIATCYRLDGPGIESRCRAGFFAPIQTGPEAHPASYTLGTRSFPGVKRPGRGVYHSPRSSAEVEERVELHICFPSGPWWPVVG